MPNFRVTLPDGRAVVLHNVPDAATAQREAAGWATANPHSGDSPVTLGGLAKSFGSGALNGTAALGNLAKPGGDPDLIQTMNQGGQWLATHVGGQSQQQAQAGFQQAENARRAINGPTTTESQQGAGLYHAPQNEPERIANTVGSFVPNAFGGGAGLVARGARVVIPALASEGARAAAQAAGGGPLAQGAAGLVGAVVGGSATGLNPNAFETATARRLTAEGIPLTIPERVGGVLKVAEDKATSLPILGDAINGARWRGIEGLNRAVANRALAPVAQTLPADVKAGNDAVAHVQGQLGDAYTHAESLITNPVPLDDWNSAVASRLAGLADAPADIRQQFSNIVNTRVTQPLMTGAGDGAALGKAVSRIREKASDMMDSGGDNRDLGRALNGTASDLQDLAGQYNPGYADAKGAVDQGWANFVRMRQAAQMQGAKGGVFNSAQLKNAVRSLDDSAGNGASARGDALLYKLADDAEQTMGGGYPDSGTAGRLLITGALGGGTAVGGHGITLPVVGGLTAASIPYAFANRGVANAFANADPAATMPAVTAAAAPRTITSLGPLNNAFLPALSGALAASSNAPPQ